MQLDTLPLSDAGGYILPVQAGALSSVVRQPSLFLAVCFLAFGTLSLGGCGVR